MPGEFVRTVRQEQVVLEVMLFIGVMAVLYLLVFSRFGIFQHKIRARSKRRRNMIASRPDHDERSNQNLG